MLPAPPEQVAGSPNTTPSAGRHGCWGDNTAAASENLGRLLTWFEGHGGSVSKVRLADLGGDMSLSLVTTGSVSKGDVVMSIPISLCMTVETAKRSDLAPVLTANPELMDSPDEVLALYLMHERRKGEGSFWREYLRTLPDNVDTPLQWIQQNSEEVRLLDGTMVGLLSGMMSKQVSKDWEEVLLPITEAHSDLLGAITFQDYLWALSSIWSRAFDYYEDDPGGSGCRRRAMVPVINAANHDPSAASSLSEMIEFERVGGVPVQNQSGEEDEEDSPEATPGGMLRVRAGRDYSAPGEQFFILYGRYSNAKLLYRGRGFTRKVARAWRGVRMPSLQRQAETVRGSSNTVSSTASSDWETILIARKAVCVLIVVDTGSYGFVLADNPYGSVDYWVKVPPSDPGLRWKQALLDSSTLTATQAYDFSGTLRSNGWVSPALLATARVAQLSQEERHAAENAFRGRMVSPRNEAAALGALLVGLRRKLNGQNNSTAEDEEQLIASLHRQMQAQQQLDIISDRRSAIRSASIPTTDGINRDAGQGNGKAEPPFFPADTARGPSDSPEIFPEKIGRAGIDSEFITPPSSSPPSVAGQSERLGGQGGVTSGDSGRLKPTLNLKLQRQIAAARVRLEEKVVISEAIGALEASLKALRVASASEDELVSFRTLDAIC